MSSIPFNYLGLPTFMGAPKTCYFQPLDDMVKSKLAFWKSKILSMMGKVQLVNSIIYDIKGL